MVVVVEVVCCCSKFFVKGGSGKFCSKEFIECCFFVGEVNKKDACWDECVSPGEVEEHERKN